MDLACPQCAELIVVDDAALAAPSGKTSYVTCPSCSHHAPASAFAQAREQQLRSQRNHEKRSRKEAARADKRERRELAKADRHKREEAQHRQHNERIAEAQRAAEARTRASQQTEQLREKERLTPVPCPVCNHACSRQASTCTNCGHPLTPPSPPAESAKGSPGLSGFLALTIILAVVFTLSGVGLMIASTTDGEALTGAFLLYVGVTLVFMAVAIVILRVLYKIHDRLG